MNARSYKTVFSKRLGTLVAVGEHASSQGKANGAGSGGGAGASGTLGYIAALTASFALVSLAWAAPANNALPTAGQVVQGAASMSQAANQLTINQGTQRAAINWQSFNIGAAAKVQVVQPNAQAVLLNRVVGQSPSQIFGQLSANGHVILVNPNGVLFGKDGSVNAGGFTASTLNISDANFMAGNMVYERNGSTAGIVNEGSITTAPGGYVALLGASVSNLGKIDTQGGNAFLGAADTIKVPVSSTGRIKLELTAADMNANVINTGSIVTESGQVYMQALALNRAAAQILQSGSIDTTGEQGGAVHLLADGGQIKVDGGVSANSTIAGNKGGDIVIGRDEITGVLARATDVSGAKLESLGGFVETSGEYLETKAVSVKAKDWLLDPTDINIRATATTTLTPSSSALGTTTFIETAGINTSEVLTSTIKSAIDNGTNVTISTANTTPGANGSGNITIIDKLDFANNSGQDATLTLLAKNGITQNAGATIKQTAGSNNNKVNVVMTSEGLHMGVAGSSTSSKGITLQAAITTNGDVTLNGTTNNTAASVGVDIRAAAAITAKNISITGKSESSYGVQSASILKGTGDVKLDGTSKNVVGVVTTNAVTADGALTIIGHKTAAAGWQAININSAVKGATVAITGDSVGHYGVGIGTSGSVESTVGDVTIIGTGTGDTTMGTSNNAVGVQVRGDITAKGKLSITGTKVGSGGYQGVTFSDAKTMKGDSIEITGTSNAWDAITFTNTTFNATKTLKVTADSTAVGKGILFSGGSTNTFTADSYLVTAKTAVNNGIYFSGTNTFNSTSATTDSLIDVTRTTAGGDTIFNAGTLTINSGAGKAALQTSTTNVGGGIRINGGSTVNTNGDVTIGSKNSGNAYTFNQGTINAQGNLTLLGKSTGDGIYMQDVGGTGSKITGTNGANITIDGTSSGGGTGVSLSINTSTNSITTTGTTSAGAVGNISITGTSASGHGISNAATEVKNNSENTTTGAKGNVTLTGTTLSGSGQGIYNAALGPNANKNAIYAKGDLTLKGYSVNGHAVNTAGTLDAGGLLKIEGTAIPTVPLLNATSIGIYVGNTAKGGTVSMTGTTGGSKGIEINAAVTSTVGGITLTGTGGGNYYYGQGVVTGAAGSLNSAAGVTIKGTATASGNNITTIGTQIQGAVTAANNILVEGKNTSTTPNFGLSIENTIKSTGGNITVNAENTSGTKTALTLNANGKLLTDAANSAININTNGMDLATGALVQAGTAGTGTVNIKTTGNNNISIGGADVTNNSAAGQTLGINNTELSQIKAGNLVIGDTGKTGNITVSGAVSTANATGNITLQTGGNIAVNAALTVSDSVSPKNLTLNGAGFGSTLSSISQTAAIKAAGLELLGTNATHTLTNTGNDIKKLAGNTGTVSLTNNAAFAIDTVNTVGLTTSGNTTLNSIDAVTQTQKISAAGLELLGTGGNYTLNNANNTIQKLAGNTGSVSLTNKGDLEVGTVNTNGLTATGDVSITTTAVTGGQPGNLTLKKNLTAANVNLNAAGAILRDAALATDGIIKASLLRIKAGAGVGTSASRIKTDVATLSVESAGDQYVTEANAVTVAAKSSEGSVNIDVTIDDLTVGSSTLIGGAIIDGIGADTGVVLTAQAGNLNINQAISNTSSGDVVLGAGVSKNAGDGSGGDVKTTSNMDVTNTHGNTYVYTGSAAGAGLLSDLDTSFSELRLSGDMGVTPLAQNADSYVKYLPGQNIAGGAKAQVMFREKITLDTSSIWGVALDKTYGDANTTSSAGDPAALFVEMQAKLKQANFGEIITRAAGGTNGANEFKISKAALINDLSGSLSAPTYSTSGHLTAKTHDYGELTSGKYTATLAAEKAQVKVAQLALTGSITPGASIYGDNLVAGSVSFTNTVGNDVVSAAGVTIDITGRASGSGHLNAGLYTDIQAVTGLKLTDADSGNYSFANVKGDYKVDQRQLTINKGAVADKTADGTTTATVTPSTLNNLVGTETLGVAATGVFSDASAGNGKAVRAFYTLQNGANGGLASNYILAVGTPTNPDTRMTGNILASVNPVINPTPSPVNNNTGSRVSTVSGFSGSGAATGVLDDKPVTESREVCSDVFPENCECQPSVVPSIEICFAPKRVAVTKEEK